MDCCNIFMEKGISIMPWTDPHILEHLLASKLMLIIGAPFVVSEGQSEGKLNKKKVAESIIIGVVTALLTTIILAIAAHVFVIKDLQNGQETIKLNMKHNLETNETAHNSIIEGHLKAMKSIDRSLVEIKVGMQKFRDDAYHFNNGK